MIFKVQTAGRFRLVQLPSETPTFAELLSVLSLAGLDAPSQSVSYKDADGDLIDCFSEDEFQILLGMALRTCDGAILIQLSPAASPSSSSQSTSSSSASSSSSSASFSRPTVAANKPAQRLSVQIAARKDDDDDDEEEENDLSVDEIAHILTRDKETAGARTPRKRARQSRQLELEVSEPEDNSSNDPGSNSKELEIGSRVLGLKPVWKPCSIVEASGDLLRCKWENPRFGQKHRWHDRRKIATHPDLVKNQRAFNAGDLILAQEGVLQFWVAGRVLSTRPIADEQHQMLVQFHDDRLALVDPSVCIHWPGSDARLVRGSALAPWGDYRPCRVVGYQEKTKKYEVMFDDQCTPDGIPPTGRALPPFLLDRRDIAPCHPPPDDRCVFKGRRVLCTWRSNEFWEGEITACYEGPKKCRTFDVVFLDGGRQAGVCLRNLRLLPDGSSH